MRTSFFEHPLRRPAAVVALLFMTSPSLSPAAEVSILMGSDPYTVRLRLDHVRFADPLTPPLMNMPLYRGGILPGDVAQFRISEANILSAHMRVWDFVCPPGYHAKSTVTLMAGSMGMGRETIGRGWNYRGRGDGRIFTGSMIWEQGACTLVRAGTWEPGRGLRWDE
jgi:hypothetical protein